MDLRLPLIWFQGIAKGAYVPLYPVWMVDEEELRHQFVVALDEAQLEKWGDSGLRRVAEESARYETDIINRRLHQPVFRARVIMAYQRRCALCQLRHVELLDAAHIKGDAEGGQPVIPNGIAMCKIHHAAFDTNIIGVR
ncbi:MAG TPA: HNH endonuclease, partial [Acidobacteriaceae bacterium]|nr:HNH endonuclease [Acidobacteriaceae bacterium]